MVLGSNLKVKYVDFYHVFKFYNCLILEFSTLLISWALAMQLQITFILYLGIFVKKAELGYW